MTPSAVQRFYRYHAYVYDSTRWLILHGRRRAVDALALRPDSRVLEIGCGTGLNFRYLLEKLDPQRGTLTGADFSDDMLVRARRRTLARGWTNVELVQADASRLELGQTFDAVLFAYSLTMIPDWERAVDCAIANLRRGGRLVVLDFGGFEGWGPLGPVMRGWLRLNHVATQRPYIDKLREALRDLQVHTWFGGYNFTAGGRRAALGAGA